MAYQIIMGRQPEKMLHRLPQNIGRRLDRAILKLADDPRPVGYRKLVGFTDLYRIRVGDWRVVYRIEEDRVVIFVVRVAPRSSAYQHLS